MNWKCKIGLHDWQYLESMNICRHRDSIMNPELANGFRHNELPLVYKRVCLQCHKYQDTMTENENKVRLEIKKRFGTS